MSKKKLANFIHFLINSYKAGLTNINIVNSLLSSPTYKNIGKKIEKDVIENRLPLSEALKKNNVIPNHLYYILQAAEQSGKIVEILRAYHQIIENQIKIENELKVYKLYFIFINILTIIGVAIFYFIFNNIVIKLVEDRTGGFFAILNLIHSILSPMNVFIFVLLMILFTIILSFRNFIVDMVEYYIFGVPYRRIVFSQIMNILGNLINAGIPIQSALFISISTVENNAFQSALNSYFSKVTNNYKEINTEIISKIFDVFPEDYHLILKNSFSTGNLDVELLEISEKLHNESSKSLKSKIILLMIIIISFFLLILGGIIVVSFLSIYTSLLEGIN